MITHELVLYFLKESSFTFLLFVAGKLQNIFFKLLFFLINLGLSKLFLCLPAFLKHFKFLHSHVHKYFDRVFDVINYVQSISGLELLFFALHSFLIHGRNLFLRSDLDIQVKINDCLSYHIGRGLYKDEIVKLNRNETYSIEKRVMIIVCMSFDWALSEKSRIVLIIKLKWNFRTFQGTPMAALFDTVTVHDIDVPVRTCASHNSLSLRLGYQLSRRIYFASFNLERIWY